MDLGDGSRYALLYVARKQLTTGYFGQEERRGETPNEEAFRRREGSWCKNVSLAFLGLPDTELLSQPAYCLIEKVLGGCRIMLVGDASGRVSEVKITAVAMGGFG